MEENNIAAMRNAVVEISKIADDWQSYANTKAGALDRIYELANAALAEPVKNCEVGTAEEQAQRFETFCSLHHLPKGKGCYSCPALPTRSPLAFQRDACRANWNQMAYEKEGGNDGSK